MTTFDTRTDLNARGRRMPEARETAESRARRLIESLPSLLTRNAPDGRGELARAARRKAAPRAVDNLMR